MCNTSSPKTVILFIHGLCGKIDRMLPDMKHFSDAGYACACFDMRGHGNSVTNGRSRPEWLQRFTSNLYNKEFHNEWYQAWICSDLMERKRFFEDPECNYICASDYLLTLLQLMKETYSKKGWHVTNPSLPILFISGEHDSCMLSIKDLHRSAGFMNTVGYTDVHSVIYAGMRHEVLNEIGKEYIWNEIENFISISGEHRDD